VDRSRIVEPTAWWVTRSAGHERLVLTSCHPPFSAAKRLVVFARLSRSEGR
jgi:sortase A